MSKISFLSNPDIIYDAEFTETGEHQVRLVFADRIPSDDILLSGFNLVNENNNHIQRECTDYTYKYREYPNKSKQIELCNNNVKWVMPTYNVEFVVNEGGILNGEAKQVVGMYEDLVVPTVNVNEGFEFVKWQPELPTKGEVLGDKTYYAELSDKNVYFHVSGGGTLEGKTTQFVANYNELEIPEVVTDDNFKFVAWMPEVPKTGKVDIENRHFYAVLESNLPDRVKTVETDLTDTQLGLVENHATLTAAEEEITNCQLALVEIYNLMSGGMM